MKVRHVPIVSKPNFFFYIAIVVFVAIANDNAVLFFLYLFNNKYAHVHQVHIINTNNKKKKTQQLLFWWGHKHIWLCAYVGYRIFRFFFLFCFSMKRILDWNHHIQTIWRTWIFKLFNRLLIVFFFLVFGGRDRLSTVTLFRRISKWLPSTFIILCFYFSCLFYLKKKIF